MNTKARHKTKTQGTVLLPPTADVTDNQLQQLAFANSLQANIVSTVSSGKIILANSAACKLFGYSKKEILTKTSASIFDIKESSFKKMLKQRSADGHSIAQVTVIKKSGKKVLCEITSVIFVDEFGDEKSITTIVDVSQSIIQQKNIDTKKEKIVADNIILAKKKQKGIDIKNEKHVADDIVLAKLKQKGIDTKKEKIVANNIILAKQKQKGIDINNEKQVADDIVLAKLKQKGIDTKKEKIVAENIIKAQAKSDAKLVENNQWIKYIAKTSYDVMWDWDVASGEMYVGESMEEVFGYQVQNNSMTITDFIGCLLLEEKYAFEKKLWKTITSGKRNWNDSFMFKRQDGSIASVTCRASIVRDEEGKAIRLIGNIQDVSRVQQLEATLEKQKILLGENLEKYIAVSRLSFDVIWDWNIVTGEVFRGEGFEKLLGYPIDEYKGYISDWNKHIHPDDKEAVEKLIHDFIVSAALNCEYTFRFIRANGTIANVFSRARIIRDANGRASRMIAVLHDLSWQKEMEEKLEEERMAKEKMFLEHEEEIKLLFLSSTEILFDVDLVTNRMLLSKAFEKEFGWQVDNKITHSDIWISHIHPDDVEKLLQDYTQAIESENNEWRYEYRLLRADKTVAFVKNLFVILRDINGKAFRIIGSMRDNSMQHMLKEELEQEIILKETLVKEAVEDAKQLERSNIGKELHDNINQLLGASKLYLDMAKRGGTASETYLVKSSECTMMAMEEIRRLSKGLTTDIITPLGLFEAIDALCNSMMEGSPLKIYCNTKGFDEYLINDIFKLNVYRIVQEQLTNILKHAKATRVDIDILQNKKSIKLTIADNGVGFNSDEERVGIGLANITSRVKSYNGMADIVSKPGEGCLLQVKFPITSNVCTKAYLT